MDKIKKKIIAIGGVGVSPESDRSLDLFILSQLKKTKNNIGFLATASKPGFGNLINSQVKFNSLAIFFPISGDNPSGKPDASSLLTSKKLLILRPTRKTPDGAIFFDIKSFIRNFIYKILYINSNFLNLI